MSAGFEPIKVLAFMEATVVNGAAKTLLNFCDTVNGARERAIEVSIATFHRGPVQPGKPPNEFVEAVQARGIEAIVIPERRAFDMRVVATMRQIARDRSPHVVQTNNVKSHFLVRMAGLHKGRRWLAFHHGYTATDRKVKLYNQLDRLSLPAADAVVAVCGPFRDQLTANGVPGARIRVLHNSAAVIETLPSADQLRSKYGIERNTKVLLTVGRLSFEKGHADLVRALGTLRQSNPDPCWKLIVVGSGPEQGRLEALARELKLSDRIVFAGHQSNVLPFYSLSDAMILPSHSEGSPHVVLEAMSAGVPIIAARVGGVPEILSDGQTARLVPVRDAQAMAAAIGNLFSDPGPARTRAANAKEVLRTGFSHEAHYREMLALYRGLLGRPQ